MTIKEKIKILFILLIFGLTLNGPSYGQKSKKDRERSEEKEILAEYQFIEGEKYFILEDYTKALGYFLKSLSNDPSKPAIHYKVAEVYAKNAEWGKAESYATQALSLNPENKYYYLLLAEIYTKQSRFSEAASLYEEMIKKIPRTHEYLFDLAQLYQFSDKPEEAIKIYNQAEQHFGKLPEITYAKQRIYLKLNKLDEAIEEGKKLVEHYPGQSEFVIKLSQIFVKHGRPEEAIPYLEALLEQDPDDANARLVLSQIYGIQNNQAKSEENLKIAFENKNLDIGSKLKLMAGYINQLPNEQVEKIARELAEKILEAHPEEANAHVINGDFFLKIKEKEKAREHYLKALELDESSFNVWLNVLQIDLELNAMNQLLKHSESALEYFPNQAIIYYYNGISNYSKKNYDEAVYSLEQGKRLAKNDANLTSAFNAQLGESYSAIKNHEKSDEAFEAALKHNPKNYGILNNYSYYLALRKEKLDIAKKMSTILVKDNPNNSTYLDTHAWVLYMAGEYKEARKYLEKALKDKNVSGTIVEHYGDVLFKLGEIDEAIEQWEKAKRKDGFSEFIDKKIADRKLYE
ncbi:tetratricopeptide repeat protein [Fulvivirgaceae bacterium BMA10]|uniref:Tetratricopeptide repeat protein n=1 Tax=Splendidivirga corallicola TaxID=3051826 RepID=A0ABT8KLK5_9BACT|nr:tetratricopeptide repeat protein [Fulvivirgaceae bacterium BMA10]